LTRGGAVDGGGQVGDGGEPRRRWVDGREEGQGQEAPEGGAAVHRVRARPPRGRVGQDGEVEQLSDLVVLELHEGDATEGGVMDRETVERILEETPRYRDALLLVGLLEAERYGHRLPRRSNPSSVAMVRRLHELARRLQVAPAATP
jgi:hypothetical protein